jgi:hypothetical protein
VLGFDEIRLGDLRLVQKVRIQGHMSIVHRRKTNEKGGGNAAMTARRRLAGVEPDQRAQLYPELEVPRAGRPPRRIRLVAIRS